MVTMVTHLFHVDTIISKMNMNVQSVSETDVPGEHQVTLNVSILQAVESSDKDTYYKESVRDGQRKRIYETPTPSHHFHIEYKLLPGKNSQVFKTDVVTFGNIVAKVYTDRDNRVVQCWNEEEGDLKLNHYGWRHKHTFKVNKAQLLELYDHVLEVRVWNTKTKLSARAKYDRPKAFRIPIRNTKGEMSAENDKQDVPGIIKRPSKFAVVYHDQVRRMKANRSRLVTSLQAQTVVPTVSMQTNVQADGSGGSIEQVSPRRSFNREGMIQEEEGMVSDGSKEGVTPLNSQGSKMNLDTANKTASSEFTNQLVADPSNQLVPASSSVAQSSSMESAGSNRQLQVMSRRRQKKLEAEAAEEARIEREGITVVRVNLQDLFGKHGYSRKKLNSPVRDLKHFEVSVSVTDTLLTEQLSKELNPMMITVVKATGLPSSPIAHEKLQQRCDPVCVRYQFHTQSSHCTPGVPQSHEAVWNDTHVTLLGTIDHQLLVEYLRGPPLVLELHDRTTKQEDKTLPALFGEETRDDVLGTHAFTAGLSHSSPSIAVQGDKPWSPYGVAKLDLSGLLTGQRVLELTVPVTNGPRCPSEQYKAATTEALPPGDYIGSQCQLKVLVEVSHPLCLSPEKNVPVIQRAGLHTQGRRSTKVTPEHTSRSNKSTPEHTPSLGRRASKLTPEHTPIGRRASKITPEHTAIGKRTSKAVLEQGTPLDRRASKLTPDHVKPLVKPPPDKCPFNRAIYIITVEGRSLVDKLITSVNQVNAKTLNLEELPEEVLPAALSTYKLTKDQMTSSDCDVITGFHVEDWDQHVIVLEGLKSGGLRKIWQQLPHHHTEDETIQKVLYNSEFEFSSRLYATLDVDLPKIHLYQPLSELTRQSLVYIKDTIPDKCFRILMTLNELSYASEMSDVTRNNLFPKPEEVTALSLQFALPASASLADNGGEDVTIDSQSTPPASPARNKTWETLDLANPQFEQHLNARRSMPAADFIAANKLRVLTLSEASASKKLRHPTRQRSLSETTHVHNYSTQTFNSIRLAKAKMRERLASDPDHRYTYSQHYHSMTVVPVDVEAEKRALKQDEQQRWQTNDGFVYPGVSNARCSNAHPKKPHPSRMESLDEPFQDNQLHANTLKPTVERMQFGWENRSEDFEHWKRPADTFGPPLPVTIHLAGERRARELQDTLDREQQEWTDKLVVSNSRFQPHRRGVRTELTESGPKAGTQLDKLSGLLKDSPQKHSLKQAGLTVHDIPALDVVHNHRLTNSLSPINEGDGCRRGYIPGPDGGRSLKLDSNVIPFTEVPPDSQCRGAPQHPQDFRLYYHIPTIPAGAMSGVVQGD